MKHFFLSRLLLAIGSFFALAVPGVRAETNSGTTFTITVPSSGTALGPVTFSYNGTNGSDGSPQTYTVPSGVYSLSVVANGAAGGYGTNNGGGPGGKVEGLLAVTPGQVLTITIGGTPTPPDPATGYNGGGYNGGGKSAGYPTYHSGGGGGATDIRQNGNALTDRVIVAGGGGGGNLTRSGDTQAGVGGGLTGGAAGVVAGGGGGTQSAGGAGGSGSRRNGQAGSLAVGGDGFSNGLATGGGGGGYYGGGGGGEAFDSQGVAGLTGSGGGGSSYTDPGSVTNVVHTQGAQSGSGQIVIVPFRTVAETNTSPVATANNNQTAPLDVAFSYTVNAFTDANEDALTYSASISPANGFSFDAATRIISGMPGMSGVSSVTVTATDPGSLSASTTFTITVPNSITALAPVTFSYNGTNGSDGSPQTYTVPFGVYSLSVVANGAAGGDASTNGGGRGGKVEGLLAVTPGQVLTITVGGTPSGPTTGYNGGGQSAGNGSLRSGGGGGATDIRQNGNALTNRVIVAGGGGGGNVGRSSGTEAGVGGGLTGGAARSTMGGGGGTQSAGGAGGSGSRRNGQAGSLAVGGDGFSNGFSTGGGGGGYYGGGSGGEELDPNYGITGSGGGGSSYTDPGSVTNVVHTQGAQSGSGQIVIVPLRTEVETNTPPVATANDNQTATVGMAFSYTVNAFSDVNGDDLSYSASIVPANGFVFDAATRVISGMPTGTGVSSVTVTATDADNLSATTTFTITVNPAPVTPLSLSFTASPTQLLTSGTTTLSATVSGGTPPYSYTFSGPGTITANGHTASVSGLSAGVQTFTVVVGDATTPASQTISGTVSVTVTQANSAPVATANNNQAATVGVAFSYTVNAFTDANGDALTYSASISPTNGFSFNPATRVISGTPTSTGVSSVTVTGSDPGTLSATTTFTITVSPSVVNGSFDGFVNGADCGSFRGWAWDRNKPNTVVSVDILDGANVIGTLLAGDFRQDLLDVGKGNGKHAFRFTIPESIKDGLSHNLSARVNGSSFILKDSPKALICTGTAQPGNKPPVPPTPTVLNAPLTAQVGVPFSGTLVAFTDPENQPLTYALAGLPDGLAIQMTSRVISGTPTQSGSFVLTYSATDPQGATNSVSFVLTVNPAGTTTVTGNFEGYLDKVECGTLRGWVWDRNKPNTPVTVEFYTDGTVWGSVVANIYRSDLKDAGKGNGAHAYSFTVPAGLKDGTTHLISARVQGSTYVLKDSGKPLTCMPPAPNRLSAETALSLQVVVLGNPVTDQVVVEVRGAEGQPLRLQLTDLSGRLVKERQIEQPDAVERQSLSVGSAPSGLLLLRASSGQQSIILKVLKP